jgi:hypothetical protein
LARKKDSQSTPAALPRRWLWQALAVILLAAALLAGLIALGRWGLAELRGRERYAVRFANIACTPPPGMTRSEFLDEVQYLSRLPDRLGLLDEDLTQKLTAAFARHPWVEKVQDVVLQPPRHIDVKLTLRKAVLAVRTSAGLIAVDRHGVRLPKNAATDDLPIFEGDAAPPKGQAGTIWGDPNVEARARQRSKL